MKRWFLIGLLGYPALELLYRGTTHYSMALAGGTAAALIELIRRLKICFPAKVLLCGTGITGLEYLCGLIWNKDYKVWDYRNTPMNVNGQVCLPYTLLWCALSAAVMASSDILEQHRKTDG